MSLREKFRKRVAGMRRQLRKWRDTGKRGHRLKALEHLEAAKFLRKVFRRRRFSNGEISEEGVQFIAEFEGFPNDGRPYNDPANYATVGYGHLIRYGPVRPGDHSDTWVEGQQTPGRLTKAEARRLLRQRLEVEYEPAVRRLFAKGGPLYGKFSQERYDALVSFVFNLGPGSVHGATGFETMTKAIRGGDIRAIANAFPLYVMAGGERLLGLVRRRRSERRLFLLGDYSTE